MNHCTDKREQLAHDLILARHLLGTIGGLLISAGALLWAKELPSYMQDYRIND